MSRSLDADLEACRGAQKNENPRPNHGGREGMTQPKKRNKEFQLFTLTLRLCCLTVTGPEELAAKQR